MFMSHTISHPQIITEIPRKRTLKKGQMMSRQMVYRDFPVVLVSKAVCLVLYAHCVLAYMRMRAYV